MLYVLLANIIILISMIFKSGKSKMIFYMFECPEREEIIDLILENGGIFSYSFVPESIFLVPFERTSRIQLHFDHPIYSYRFIHESVALGYLQHLKSYEMNHLIVKLSKPRLAYTQTENELMLKFVRENLGNPNNMQYWAYANQTLHLNHSSDSLRAHWKVLQGKDPSSHQLPKLDLQKSFEHSPIIKKIAKEEDFSATQLLTPTTGLNVLPESGKYNISTKVKEDGECKKSIRRTCVRNDHNGVKENVAVRRKVIIKEDCVVKIKAEDLEVMDGEKIEKMFMTLVELCRYKAHRTVSPRLVAKVLVHCKGSVRETLELF